MTLVAADTVEIESALLGVLHAGKLFELSVTSHPPTVERTKAGEESRQAERAIHFHMRRLGRRETCKIRYRMWRYGKVVCIL